VRVNRLSLLVLFAAAAAPLLAAEKQIDPAHSTLTIHVGKTGLLSAAGHEHTVMAPIERGTIADGEAAHVNFDVEAARMMVLPESHRDEIQQNMQEHVLDSARFPHIRFVSESVKPAGDGVWNVSGKLTLHGETRPVLVHVELHDGAYAGATTIKQTDFGIEPVSAGGGTVKVKNELKIDFMIRAK